MRAAGVGPLAATANGCGSVNAAASIFVVPVPVPDNAAHAAAASLPRPRSAAVAMEGATQHRNIAAIAARARGARRSVIVLSSHGLILPVSAGYGLAPYEAYFPVHYALRFSPTALRPSLASSAIARLAICLSFYALLP